MTLEPIFDRGRAALATVNELLIAELAAGNGIAGTPTAACGRVALGIACALMRQALSASSPGEPLVQAAQV